jgi:hypothetical protein
MDTAYLLRQLQDNAGRIQALVAGTTQEEARWKPDAKSWSILEVVNHLYDEERQDFRVRLDIILHQPEKDWPPINPEGWVLEREYNQRDLEASLEAFLAERKQSIAWLASLEAVDWETAQPTPWGTMKAGDMFASWVTHDQLHMRQLVELHRARTEYAGSPYNLDYAGTW